MRLRCSVWLLLTEEASGPNGPCHPRQALSSWASDDTRQSRVHFAGCFLLVACAFLLLVHPFYLPAERPLLDCGSGSTSFQVSLVRFARMATVKCALKIMLKIIVKQQSYLIIYGNVFPCSSRVFLANLWYQLCVA